jgi:hypothetical protein
MLPMKCSFDARLEQTTGEEKALRVTGTVLVSHPDVRATFAERVPAGMDPDVLLMTLVLEAPGAHPHLPTERPLSFAKAYSAGAHLPARIEVHTTSGDSFTCEVVRAH